MITVEIAREQKILAEEEWRRQIEQQCDANLCRYGNFSIYKDAYPQAMPLIERYKEAGFDITWELKDKEGNEYVKISIPVME